MDNMSSGYVPDCNNNNTLGPFNEALAGFTTGGAAVGGRELAGASTNLSTRSSGHARASVNTRKGMATGLCVPRGVWRRVACGEGRVLSRAVV